MIDVQNLTVKYQGKTVLEDISLQFQPGEIVAMIGANGCGKSTLLRCIAGLQMPQSGRVFLHGQPTSRYARRAAAQHIGYLSQSPQAPEGVTVRQLVEHGAFAKTRLFRRPDKSAVDKVLERVDLSAFADRTFAGLSGGEKQRAWIALALLQSPEILLLDEPTSFLDLGYQIEILQLIEDLKHERGMGIIMVLHNINEAARFADRIVAIHAGRIERDGPPDTLDADLVRKLLRARVSLAKPEGSPPFFRPDW